MRTSSTLRGLLIDEDGFVVSSELMLMSSLVVLGLLVGLESARSAVTAELSDVVGSMQDLNQSFSVDGIVYHNSNVAGFDFVDATDECDSPDQSDALDGSFMDNCIAFFGVFEEGAPFDNTNFPRTGEPIFPDPGGGVPP
jgi:hypothetical protein